MTEINRKNLQELYEKLKLAVSDSGFLSNQGLNNEVPFHICPYEPTIQGDMSQLIKQLKNELLDEGIATLEVNLYDLVIELLKEEGDWEWLLANEASLGKDQLKEELQGILDVENIIAPAIEAEMKSADFQVMLITGVGEVFPYIRSHNILNNLQKYAKDKPTLMFFPGGYQHSLDTGASLVLFGKLRDDKYYRAFNILDRAV
jgi:hypothetical protein